MEILTFIGNMFVTSFQMMDRVEIFGVSFLDFSISLVIIGAIFTVLIAHIGKGD